MDNHWKFLDWDKRNNQFTGVLSYAYYDNVIITLQRKIISEYTTNTYSENYTIELNAAVVQWEWDAGHINSTKVQV